MKPNLANCFAGAILMKGLPCCRANFARQALKACVFASKNRPVQNDRKTGARHGSPEKDTLKLFKL